MTDVTPQPESPPPLPVLMGRVLADVPAVGKNSAAPANMGGYAFRGIEDVLAALKPAMAKHGVFCVPHIAQRIPSERHLSGGKIMFVVDLFIVWTFYGPAGDTIQADAWGQGTDMGDKATQKAMTSAFKSMLMQTFVIGDSATDAEAHSVPETERQQVDPEAWFKQWGWVDRTAHDERRKALVASARELDEKAREVLKKWVDEEGQSHPDKPGWATAWPLDLAEKIAHKVELLKTPDGADPASTPEPPAPAPLSVAEADSVGTALVEHLKGLNRAELIHEFSMRQLMPDESWTDDKMRQKLGLKMLAEGWRPPQVPPTATDPTICAWCGTGRTDTNELVDYREDGVMHPGCHDDRLKDREAMADPGRVF